MKKQYLLLCVTCLILLITSLISGREVFAASYMSNKTELHIDLEVSGAEAICQTEDGYVWIAQYSGLTRYDSQDFETFKSFEFSGKEYAIINVRALAADGTILYIATSEQIYVYKDFHFEPLLLDAGVITDILLDKDNQLLYISTQDNGGIIYDIAQKTKSTIPGTEGITVRDVALGLADGEYFYRLDNGVYDRDGKTVLASSRLLEIYSYGTTLFMAEDTGIIHRYDMEKGKMLEDLTVPDQVNRLLYSETDDILFVACEKTGIYCIDLNTPEPRIALAGDLENKSQLVDLMIDYQGNLWIASHYIGASGLSVITKNALSELLYDDPVWQSLNAPPAFDRNVYAVEKYGDILYIIAATRIYRYDLKSNNILPDNIIMQTIDEYAEIRDREGKAKDSNYTFSYAPKDVEIFRDKIYFAVYGIGLVEYDPDTESAFIYDAEYIKDHTGIVMDVDDIDITTSLRSMRSFGDYLALGYTRGIMRFDGTTFDIMNLGTNVLYINKTNDGKILYDRTQGLFIIDDDFTTVTEIPTVKGITGNRLKFLVDGDTLYYTLNSRLFRTNMAAADGVSEEIAIPYIKGSIVELAKIRYTGRDGKDAYKYVIGSQSQLYIADSLEGDRLTDYETFDSTNGLQPIIANTSGYYDEAEQKYYLQSTNGIFVYDFNLTTDIPIPVRIAVSSVDLDGKPSYGESISISKDVYRVTFNLSVFGFRPNNGYTVYYKLDGIDSEYIVASDDSRSEYYTNLAGGSYDFHVYVTDEYGQLSNTVSIHLEKEKKVYEQWWFWAVLAVIAAGLIYLISSMFVRFKTRQSLKRQLEYKNITLESIEAIARTITPSVSDSIPKSVPKIWE